MICAHCILVRCYSIIIELELRHVENRNKEHLACKLIIFLSFYCFSFYNKPEQYLEFNTCEINDITLQFLRNRKPCIKKFVELIKWKCIITRKQNLHIRIC